MNPWITNGKIIRIHWILLFILVFPLRGHTQDDKLLFQGYVSNMQSVMFEHLHDNWTNDNLFHNRLQLKWFAANDITTNLEIRNRFFYGESMQIPGYKDLFIKDRGWADLSFDITSGTSYILNSKIDRAWIAFNFDKLNVKIGRQRINWGKTMVWNPNDIFNAYSFFDFDYVEKPGCDAIRLQYYTGSSSNLEVSVKADNQNRITAAGILRINPGMYDLQFFSGFLNDEDYVAGTGWAGNIKGAGFSGELTLFQPRDSAFGKGDMMFSIGTNYTFKNALFLQVEFLYSSVNYNDLSFTDFYFMPLTVKDITFTDYNIFTRLSYPFTPLLSGTFSAMYFPSIKGYFVGPSLSYSLQDNLDLSLFLQHFDGEFNKLNGKQQLTLAFLRLKWSF